MFKINKNKNLTGLLATTLFLVVFGLISLYSASTVESYKNTGTTSFYIFHQLKNGLLLGVVFLIFAAMIDFRFWQKTVAWFLLVSLSLLVAVKFTSFGFSAGGANRWLDLGFINLQPSEIAKLAIIFYLASWADKKREQINNFYFGLLPPMVVVAIFCGLILLQPDFGTMLIIIAVSASMFFISGLKAQYILLGLFLGITLLYTFVHFEPYRARRITSFLDSNFDPKGISYHTNQAILAIGSGGYWGYGYGLSRQKYQYLPEVMNDSIFAVSAEELGFFRIIIVPWLFFLFAYFSAKIGNASKNIFGKLCAYGIGVWISVQAIINIGAMLKLLPLTGIPLPFFSYGSTSLVLNLFAVGILINIASRSNETH